MSNQPTQRGRVESTGQSLEEVKTNLERINFWIGNCDTKISFSLAFAGILLGGFFSSSIITGSLNKVVEKIAHMSSIHGYWQTRLTELTLVILLAFIVLMAFSITYLFRGLKGSIDTAVYKQDGLTNDSKVFFGTIAIQSFQQFKQKAMSVSEADMLNDYLSQVYINSKICKQKFDLYNKGVKYLIWATISFVVLNILFLFIK